MWACEFVRTIHGNSFSVSSASLNTGGHNETETKFVAAKQVVYHGHTPPSHVLLPVIPAEELER